MISKYFILLRNIIINNFFVNIECLIKNNNYIIINPYYNYLIFLIPFIITKHILLYFNYDIIYRSDNIYTITNIHQNHILPVLLKFNVDSTFNILNSIKYFNSSIPLYFILYKYGFLNNNHIDIEYFHNGKIIKKTIIINNHKMLKLYQLFI